MSFIHRGVLYLLRKRAKSLLLLLLLLVIATLVLSGVAIRDATKTAQLNVRQALGGVFTLQQNTSDPDKWVSSAVGSFGSTSYYAGTPLTEELADYIQENVSGITGYNASYTNYVVPVGEDGGALELIESEIGDSSMDSSFFAGYGDFNSTVAAYASTNTAYDSYFMGGYLELTEGRHVTAADPSAALISQSLAERNGLKVGDRITLRMSEYSASLRGYDARDTEIGVEIVGLFQPTAKSTAVLSNWSMDNAVFTTLDVVRTARPDMGDESYEKISFYVDDPGQLDAVVGQVQELPELDPSDFVVNVDTSGVDSVLEPLTNMDRLVFLLILLVIAVGAVILYLVLASRVKERTHESGILLSLGFSKRSITLQYLTEVLLLAALAFSLAVFASGAVARAVGSGLLDYTLAGTASGAGADGIGTQLDGVMIANSGDFAPTFQGQSALTQIQVAVRPASILLLCGAGAAVICLSVVMAALPVLRMKPREILSKMS